MYDHVGLIASNLTVWNSAYPGKGGTYDHLRMLTGRVPFRGHNTLMLEWNELMPWRRKRDFSQVLDSLVHLCTRSTSHTSRMSRRLS